MVRKQGRWGSQFIKGKSALKQPFESAMTIGVNEGKAKQKPYAGRCMTVEEWPKAGSLRAKRCIKGTRTLLPVRIYRHTKYSLRLCPAVGGRVLVKDVASPDLLTGSH